MNSINKFAMTAALALSSAGAAFAATTVNVVHVTGSTAFRAADVTAETAWLNGLGSGGVTAVYFDSGSSASLTHAGASIIYGPVVSGTQYIFENLFTGSIGGDESLVSPTPLAFPAQASYASLATAVTVGSSSATSTGGQIEGKTGYTTETGGVNPDIAFSDVFFDTALSVINDTDGTSDNLGVPTDRVVGIIPFVFVASASDTTTKGKLSSLSVTPQLFTQLYNKGHLPLSFLTGATGDSTFTAYALGRDIDSGTRATALAETGITLNGNGNKTVNDQVNQYYPFDNSTDYTNDTNSSSSASPAVTKGVVGIDSTATTIGYLGAVPPEDVDDYEMSQGDGGYASGGNLQAALNASFSGISNTALFAYLGVSDANAALNASNAATLLSYNGVTFDPRTANQSTTNSSQIYSGRYSFWGYEHEFYFGSGSVADTAAAGIQTQLTTNHIDTLASNGVAITSMTVSRTDDGLAVTAGNPYNH